MERHQGREVIRDRLIFWMVHICLRQFRVDILRGVQSGIHAEHRDEALQGQHGFCFEYLAEIMGEPIYLISGNRCDFKQPTHLGHFLFDFDDGRTRKHWEDRGFRKLYRRARTGLRVRHPGRLWGLFVERFWASLYAYHWVLPYPCAEVLTQTTKQGQRMWYSIELEEGEIRDVEQGKPEDWKWARKDWRRGYPRRVPRYTQWSKEEWIEWIEQNRNP